MYWNSAILQSYEKERSISVFSVTVNNSIFINKTSYLLLTQTMEHKIPRIMALEINVVDWDRHTNVAELNRFNGILWIWK